jgi:hypothetical protein
MPAGMTTRSAPENACFMPSSLGRKAVNFCAFSQLVFTILIARHKTYCWRGDVRQVGTDAGSVDHIVEGEIVDERADLQQKGQWL